MKKRTMKLLSLLLAIAMMLSLAPLSVFAADEEPTETAVVAEEPAEEPADPEEPVAEEPATGSVVAVVYGEAMEAALLGVEQDYNLLDDDFYGEWYETLNRDKYKGRTIPKLQTITGDTTPKAIFSLDGEDGSEVDLVEDTSPKGSEFVKVDGERADLLTDALDGIKANNFTVYRADDLAPGTYTLRLKYMDEPYGLRNEDLLVQKVTVEAGKTTIAGGDALEVRGFAKETVSVDTGEVRRTYGVVGTHEETYTLFGREYTRTVNDYGWIEEPIYRDETTKYDFTLSFPGYFFRKESLGFKFRTTDVADKAVEGAEFVMVNRDDLLGLLEPVLGLGKDVFSVAIGQFTGENLPTFEDLVSISQSILAQNDQGFVTISWEGIQSVITGYIATLTTALQDVDLAGHFIVTGEDAGLLGFKLKHPLPAILSATSDENGVVTFDTTKNVTLTFLIDVIANLGMDTLAAVSGNNEALNALLFPIKLVMDPDSVSVKDLNVAALANLIDLIPAPETLGSSWDQIKSFIKNAAATGDTAIDSIFNFINGLVNWIPGVEIDSKEMLWNTITSFVKNSKDTLLNFLYDQLQNIGIVGDKISKGNYLLFEYKTPDAILDEEGNVLEDYSRSPLIYTVNVDWKEPDNVYATVTDLGLIGPYIAPQFYDFVRNTQYEGIVAKSLGKQAWDYDFLSKLMTGKIALTEKTKQQVQGAFTAYMADALYDALGLNVIFNTRIALMEGMNDYLVAKSDTAKNLRTYVNAQAKKAKSVYAGTLTSLSAEVAEDDLWTFYTLDRSPTLTATKLINKSTENIAAAYPDVQKPYVEERGKIVSGLVNTVGTTIENTVKSVTDRIAEATRSVVERVISGVRDGIKNLISGLLGNLGNLFGGNSSTGTTTDEPSANAGA